ncbi:unnamed protein product, partial [Chrysoparadoxa australica]
PGRSHSPLRAVSPLSPAPRSSKPADTSLSPTAPFSPVLGSRLGSSKGNKENAAPRRRGSETGKDEGQPATRRGSISEHVEAAPVTGQVEDTKQKQLGSCVDKGGEAHRGSSNDRSEKAKENHDHHHKNKNH